MCGCKKGLWAPPTAASTTKTPQPKATAKGPRAPGYYAPSKSTK